MTAFFYGQNQGGRDVFFFGLDVLIFLALQPSSKDATDERPWLHVQNRVKKSIFKERPVLDAIFLPKVMRKGVNFLMSVISCKAWIF